MKNKKICIYMESVYYFREKEKSLENQYEILGIYDSYQKGCITLSNSKSVQLEKPPSVLTGNYYYVEVLEELKEIGADKNEELVSHGISGNRMAGGNMDS